MNRTSIIAREGYPFLLLAGGLVLLFAFLGFFWGVVFFGLATLFVAFFFRNPERVIPEGRGLVVSPADGKVMEIKRGEMMPLTNERAQRISIFLNILNVHINRAPVAGVIRDIAYTRGKFLIASCKEASYINERNTLLLEDDSGRLISFSQIAGVAARRIVCYPQKGERLERGERFGLIRFGSRLDLFLPETCSLAVREGEKVKGGSSILGRFS